MSPTSWNEHLAPFCLSENSLRRTDYSNETFPPLSTFSLRTPANIPLILASYTGLFVLFALQKNKFIRIDYSTLAIWSWFWMINGVITFCANSFCIAMTLWKAVKTIRSQFNNIFNDYWRIDIFCRSLTLCSGVERNCLRTNSSYVPVVYQSETTLAQNPIVYLITT
jgi:hypothetical protein